MSKGQNIKLRVQKILFCFTKISAENLLHILGYSFCTEHHNFAHFLPNAVAFKSFKNYLLFWLVIFVFVKQYHHSLVFLGKAMSLPCILYLKVCLHRWCGPAILPSDAISIENFLSPRHRFEMDIPFEIYAPRNWNHIAQQNRQPHIACVNTP